MTYFWSDYKPGDSCVSKVIAPMDHRALCDEAPNAFDRMYNWETEKKRLNVYNKPEFKVPWGCSCTMSAPNGPCTDLTLNTARDHGMTAELMAAYAPNSLAFRKAYANDFGKENEMTSSRNPFPNHVIRPNQSVCTRGARPQRNAALHAPQRRASRAGRGAFPVLAQSVAERRTKRALRARQMLSRRSEALPLPRHDSI